MRIFLRSIRSFRQGIRSFQQGIYSFQQGICSSSAKWGPTSKLGPTSQMEPQPNRSDPQTGSNPPIGVYSPNGIAPTNVLVPPNMGRHRIPPTQGLKSKSLFLPPVMLIPRKQVFCRLLIFSFILRLLLTLLRVKTRLVIVYSDCSGSHNIQNQHLRQNIQYAFATNFLKFSIYTFFDVQPYLIL